MITVTVSVSSFKYDLCGPFPSPQLMAHPVMARVRCGRGLSPLRRRNLWLSGAVPNNGPGPALGAAVRRGTEVVSAVIADAHVQKFASSAKQTHPHY